MLVRCINEDELTLRQISVQTYNNAAFESNHAEISEASLTAWFKNNPELQEWGMVLGNHHGERAKPMVDNSDSYG